MSKNTFFRIILFALLLFTCQIAHGETLKFDHFSNKEGFNQNTINAIVEDKYGFLWIGTPNGLIKYDGYDFYNYTHDPLNKNSISNNYIQCLFNDSEGNLWIGTRTGINVYIPEYESFLKVPFYSNLWVQQISADSEGRIWISGAEALLTCKLIQAKGETSFEVSENFLESETGLSTSTDFCFMDNNRLLLFKEHGLFSIEFETTLPDSVIRKKAVVSYTTLADAEIKAILKSDNIFWIGTTNGLYKIIIDGERIRIMEKFELSTNDNRKISDLNVLSIFEDNSGNVWIGSVDEGIFKYNPQTDSFINYGYDPKNKNGISSPRINCFFQDRFDVIWIGTAQGGLNKLDVRQKQFLSYSNNPYDDTSISGNLINSILEDRQGRLWVANYNDVVCRSTTPVNDNTVAQLRFQRIQYQNKITKDGPVAVIYEDEKGFIWFGASRAVAVFNPHNNKCKTIKFRQNGKGISLTSCRVIHQINSTTILFGGDKVLTVKNPWETIQNQAEPSLNVSSIFTEIGSTQAIAAADDGKFWFGTNLGLFLCKYNNNKIETIQTYSSDEGTGIKLTYNNIFALHLDNNGNLWVGTFGGGLNKLTLNKEGFPVKVDYSRKNGILPDDAVYGILQEDDEHIWISTDMGLCRIHTDDNKIDLFDVRDGLINNNFRQEAYHKGKSGYFYFGGLNGLTVFKPENIKLNDVLPYPQITGISINNNPIEIGEKIQGKVILEESVFETNKLRINNTAKIISFHLVAQHSAAPLKNKIAYMLEGFNDKWIEIEDGKTSITYTNLPAGDFTLRIKCANGDGLWNEETRDLRLTVLPPWYKTLWAIIIFIVVAIAIIVGVFIYLVNHEKLKQSLKYEKIDKKRIDTINQGKLQFFTKISHEFRTPLTLIAGPLEHLMNNNNDGESTKYLTIIQNNTKRLMSLVDQLITFRQVEQGHLNLNLSVITLGNFIYPATEAFEDFAIQKNVNFFYKINSPNEEVVIDVEKTERIIFNLLSNSFRHTPIHGNISIETDVVWIEKQKMISIKVIDTGRGIPKEKQDKIFERFYQLEGRKENVGGTGIGLAFSKSLIDLMGGTISVESEPNTRTCFSILVPSKEIDDKHLEMPQGETHSFIKDWIPSQVSDDEVSKKAINEEKAHTLVIVEDEADVRDFLMKSLGRQYAVILAENGVDGLNKIKQNKPDLVLSDVMMPEMNGFEMCEKVKSDPETCHIPVILLTALGEKENQIKGLEFRADDYISKPFSPKHLEVRVKTLIANNQRLKDYFSKNSSIPDKTIQISTRDKNFLNQVITAIENNLSDSNFGVEELATEISLSPSQFYRRLKQLTGQIPNVYLRNFRLQRAAELLGSNEGLNVAEVMYQIGIESNSYFSTSFKKLHGVSPSEFIKKHKA